MLLIQHGAKLQIYNKVDAHELQEGQLPLNLISNDQQFQLLKDNKARFAADADNNALVEEFIAFVEEGKLRIKVESKGDGEAEDSPSKLKSSALITGAKKEQSVFILPGTSPDQGGAAAVPPPVAGSPRDEAMSRNSVEGRFEQSGTGQYTSQMMPVNVPVTDP